MVGPSLVEALERIDYNTNRLPRGEPMQIQDGSAPLTWMKTAGLVQGQGKAFQTIKWR